ncbi:glycosyltransferase family 2 protein [Chitinibacteraceae bacterium HSL-7]
MLQIDKSLIIPVYKNEESLPSLFVELEKLSARIGCQLEVIFVVDGSPDRSYHGIKQQLTHVSYSAQVIQHARNFGSFAAIRTGMKAARGHQIAMMAADLQEPPELVVEMFSKLSSDSVDIVVAARNSRKDPWRSKMASNIFWGLYRRWIVKDIPPGGVDLFACTAAVRDQLVALPESRSSLVAQLFWVGFRRTTIYYERVAREHGVSAWTFRKKVDYMLDSIFSFTDLPVRLLSSIGFIASALSLILGVCVVLGKWFGWISVPGYAALMLTVTFFGGLNIFGLGVVGTYAWRTYENSKCRPLSINLSHEYFD